MVLKIVSKKGQSTYMSAEEFSVHKISVKDLYKNFVSHYEKTDIMYFNDRHNLLVRKIQELTSMDNQIIDFRFDCEFEDLDLVCCIYPRTKAKEHNIIATNLLTYLMSDDGKTIERLI